MHHSYIIDVLSDIIVHYLQNTTSFIVKAVQKFKDFVTELLKRQKIIHGFLQALFF